MVGWVGVAKLSQYAGLAIAYPPKREQAGIVVGGLAIELFGWVETI